MEALFETLTQPGEWTQTQWLALLIALFLLAAAAYFVWKLVDIVKSAGKSSYKPNIGLHRRGELPPEGVNAPRRDNAHRGEKDDSEKRD